MGVHTVCPPNLSSLETRVTEYRAKSAMPILPVYTKGVNFFGRDVYFDIPPSDSIVSGQWGREQTISKHSNYNNSLLLCLQWAARSTSSLSRTENGQWTRTRWNNKGRGVGEQTTLRRSVLVKSNVWHLPVYTRPPFMNNMQCKFNSMLECQSWVYRT